MTYGDELGKIRNGEGPYGSLPILTNSGFVAKVFDFQPPIVVYVNEVGKGDEHMIVSHALIPMTTDVKPENSLLALHMSRENLQRLHNYLGKMLVEKDA